MLIVAAVLLAGIVILLGALLIMSPGKPRPIVDQSGNPVPGSLSEKIRVDINGVEQGMFIRSRDPANPVLLFVHGGPGVPEYWLTAKYPSRLEDYFTVCWWEQRGGRTCIRLHRHGSDGLRAQVGTTGSGIHAGEQD